MSKKIYLTLESIQEEYFGKGKNLADAAKALGCSVTVLRNCIHSYGMKPKDNTWNREAFFNARYVQPTKLIPKEVIQHTYLDRPINLTEAVAELKTSEEVFIRSMRAYGLQPKSKTWNAESRRSRFPLLNNKDLLAEEMKTKSFNQIARENGCTSGAVVYSAVKYGLHTPSAEASDHIKAGLNKAFPNGKKPEQAGNWQGGTRSYPKGYVGTHSPDHPNATKEGYVMEHRLVMEKHLGRYLTKDEVVHHKNGRKDDNRIENLELVSDRGSHTREHFERSHVTELERIEKEQLRDALRTLDPNHPLLTNR
jgi:hypothetical protein